MKKPNSWWLKAGFPAGLGLAAALLLAGRALPARADDDDRKENVGFSNSNHIVLPVNQILTPAGLQVELPGSRPQVIALSPDGRLLAVAANVHHLILVDAATGRPCGKTFLCRPDNASEEEGSVSSRILAPDTKGAGELHRLDFFPGWKARLSFQRDGEREGVRRGGRWEGRRVSTRSK